jgi:hypothetical protein
MGTRSRSKVSTILTVAIRVQLPPGMNQGAALAALPDIINHGQAVTADSSIHCLDAMPLKKETIYHGKA